VKVALLYPAVSIDGFARALAKPKTGWIHHGLCYISASLKNAGHAVSLIDLRQLTGWAELSQAVKDAAPDIVGITMMSVDFDAAIRAARMIKDLNSRIKVIAGGAHPSLAGSELEKNPDIDYIFKGEAEVTLPLVLEDLLSGKIKTKIITGEAPDLERLPFVDRTLFKILEAPIVPFLKMPFVTAIAGRGCTYNCSFCQPAERRIFGPKVRRLSAERFVEELDITRKGSGLNSLMIHDDCLVEDAEWVSDFLRLYSAKRFRKSFVCQARADIIVKNKALFRKMKRHGLEMLLIGFESGNQRILNLLRKGTTVEQNYEAAEICKRLGIRIWANFMLGIPTETNEEAADTVKMIKRIKPYVPSPAFYTPHPGSDLFDFCVKNNLSLIEKHEDYKRNPEGRKVKGVDYAFLTKALAEIGKVPLSVRLKRKIDRLRLGSFNRELISSHSMV
jgi:radical SAM superfamily enzyme YgiQ (UPF0313 family)